MYYHPCVSGCGRYLPLLRSGVHPSTLCGAASSEVRGDLRIMVRAFPSGVPHPSSSQLPVGVPLDRAGTFVEVLMWNPPPPIIRGWTSGFSVGVVLVLSDPLWCHSSRKCMRSLQDRGRHLSLLETNLVAPPPSPPLMVKPLWGTQASPLWNGLWPCNYVQQLPPLCGVSRVSPHRPVSIHRAVFIELVGRRLLPYMPWRYCRSIRPKPWETCTRVVMTWRFYTSCVLRWTSRSEQRRWPHSLWVMWCPRLWSRSAISGCVWPTWMLPCCRPASSATLSRALPSSFRQHKSRLRWSNTEHPSCPFVEPGKGCNT